MNKLSEKKSRRKLYSPKQTPVKEKSLQTTTNPVYDPPTLPFVQMVKTWLNSRQTTIFLALFFALLLMGFLLKDSFYSGKGGKTAEKLIAGQKENPTAKPALPESGLTGENLSDTQIVISDESGISPDEDIPAESGAEKIPDAINLGSPDGIFDILGNPLAGEPLQFRIRNYDPSIVYEINLGNGERQRVFKETTYRYAEPGSFKVTLSFSKPGEPGLFVHRYLKIKPVEIEETDNILAENPIPPASSSPLAKADTQLPKNPVRDSGSFQTGLSGPGPSATTLIKEQPQAAPVQPQPVVKTEKTEPVISPKTPLEFAEKMPAYPGGSKALNDFFNQQINYPEMARENEIEGKVYVRFVVRPDGSASDFTVVRGIGFGCDEEALRVVNNMPKWIPGEQSGQKVSVIKTLPITFRFK
ncbi:MAG: TonB family protein [Bacteroidia bacterium]